MTHDQAAFRAWADVLPEALLVISVDGVVLDRNSAASRAGLDVPVGTPLHVWLEAPSDVVHRRLRQCARARNLIPLGFNKGGQRLNLEGARLTGPGEPVRLLLRAPVVNLPQKFMELDQRIQQLRQEVGRRRMSEQALAAERERLQVTLASIGDAVLTTDVEGRVTLLNPIAEQLTGWTHRRAVGRSVQEVFKIYSERTGERVQDPVAKVLKLGRIVGLANHTALEKRDGTQISIADSAAPIRDPNGKIVGVVLVFRDVGSEYALEQELARVSKLESLGVLAGGIAHDFNNVLTAIMANLSLAMPRLPCHAARARLEAAHQACERARDLTSQLLTFARGGEPSKEATVVEPIVVESCNLALQGSASQASIQTEPDLPPVDADPSQLGQVLHNLVLNASQAMPRGGTVYVRAQAEHVHDDTLLPLQPDDYVRIEVQDEGPGIPPELLERIFDPFLSTKSKGSGLGLATVHSIVKRHGGHVSVRSEKGRGATFRVWLPQAQEQAVADLPARPPQIEGRGWVLVMDDDPAIRRLAQECLQTLGYESATACDGAEALELWQRAIQEGQPFRFGIFDLTVRGGLGGREAMQMLLRHDPGARVLVSSGYSHDPVLARYRDFGFVGVLAKPYSLEDLARSVAQATREED